MNNKLDGLSMDLENKINAFLGREKITAKAERQFLVEVKKDE